MNLPLIVFLVFFESYTVDGVRIIWDNSVDFNFNNFDTSSRTDEVRMPNRFFIYPGNNTFIRQTKGQKIKFRNQLNPLIKIIILSSRFSTHSKNLS